MLSSRIWSSISVALSCQLWLAVSQGRTSKALKTDATPDSAAVWWVINSVAFYQDKQKDLLQGGGCQVVRAFSNVKARAEAGKRSKWSSASGATWAQDNGIAPFCITPEGQYKDSAKVYVSYDELANDNVMYIVHRGLRQDSSEDKISGDSIQMQGVWTTNDDTLMYREGSENI